jgi:tight adherence protein B
MAAMIAAFSVSVFVYKCYNIMTTRGPMAKKRLLEVRLRSALRTANLLPFQDKEISIRKKSAHNFGDIDSIRKFLARHDFTTKLAQCLPIAKINLSVTSFLGICILSSFATFIALRYMALIQPLCLIIAVLMGYIPILYVRKMKEKYFKDFQEQFPNAIGMVANSLKAGHTVEAAISIVAASAPQPCRGEFSIINGELKIGRSLVEAIRNLYKRLPIQEIQALLTGISVQQKTGGNLSEMLNNLEQTLRNRIKIAWEIKALSSEGRASIIVMVIIPFAILVPQILTNPPAFFEFAATEAGKMSLGAAGFLQIIGVLWVKQIVKMKVN